MEQNIIKQVKECISQADQVLIGIGENWNLFPGNPGEHDLEADYESVLALDEKTEKGEKVRKAYEILYDLVKDKPYFLITMNTDDTIYSTSFEKEKITAPCGSVHMLQCHQHILETFETAPIFQKMREAHGKSGKIWMEGEDFPPRCPVCNGILRLHTIDTEGYLEDGYLPQWKVYREWLTRTLNKKLCVLELGVSFAHPSVIRFPFEKTAFYNNQAVLIRVNDRFYQLPQEMKEKGISVKADAVDFVLRLEEA